MASTGGKRHGFHSTLAAGSAEPKGGARLTGTGEECMLEAF